MPFHYMGDDCVEGVVVSENGVDCGMSRLFWERKGSMWQLGMKMKEEFPIFDCVEDTGVIGSGVTFDEEAYSPGTSE
ncbi:Hypothetical predicted protein [Olea europaea subsp. europaea]|uniref:Uncharacterized protein n=1 Tax=Olea europaea subsp. europaea TaxID=158383 RepID=A0A8S0S678_OLEEU|nr:Hypothetical predicted protein [Olea europaea subsp. europaea]